MQPHCEDIGHDFGDTFDGPKCRRCKVEKRWIDDAYQRGYDAGCDDPESVWTSTLMAERERVAQALEAARDGDQHHERCSLTEAAAIARSLS